MNCGDGEDGDAGDSGAGTTAAACSTTDGAGDAELDAINDGGCDGGTELDTTCCA